MKKTDLNSVKDVKNIIAVGSGKGGVGKSTVAANIALSLALHGFKTGILDGDIYGPSIPGFFGINEKKPAVENEKIIPPQVSGIKIVSMGFMLDGDAAVIWRGPLISGAVKQFITDVDWGELDYLVIDLPPGTGDVSLTIAQTLKLSGLLLVTTPQQAAAEIASKAASLFKGFNVPILGIVENMSYFVCPKCGEQTEIFSGSGSTQLSKKTGIDIIARIPVIPGFMENGNGNINNIEKNENIRTEYEKITEKIIKKEN